MTILQLQGLIMVMTPTQFRMTTPPYLQPMITVLTPMMAMMVNVQVVMLMTSGRAIELRAAVMMMVTASLGVAKVGR